MATVNLGAIKFNWKGAFNNSTAYAVDDVVSSGGSSYVCILASQGNAVSNGTYWNQMSAAGTNGTNGTDLTSTLTTRGDIVYKGASALTRLPKGTAGYVLKQGANDPEWGEAGGGKHTLISSTTISGSPTNVDLVNGTNGVVINSTYDHYIIDFLNVASATDVQMLAMQYMRNGSAYTTGNYVFSGEEWYRASGSSSQNRRSAWGLNNYTFGSVGASNASGEQNLNAQLKFFPNGYGAELPNWKTETTWWQDNDQHVVNYFTGTSLGTVSEMSTFNGFRFFWTGDYNSNVVNKNAWSNQGKIKLYGVKA